MSAVRTICGSESDDENTYRERVELESLKEQLEVVTAERDRWVRRVLFLEDRLTQVREIINASPQILQSNGPWVCPTCHDPECGP